jgi:hypothetical protein
MAKLGLALLSVCSLLTFLNAPVVTSRASEASAVVLAGDTAPAPSEAGWPHKLFADLCGPIDVDEFHRLRDRLDARVRDNEELSRMEAEVADAVRHDCRDPGIAADLMRGVAWNWKVQGDLVRADQLYRQAYAIYDLAPDDRLGKEALLQEWAELKLAAGESDQAINLAKLRTTLARKHASDDASFDDHASTTLIAALNFQAYVLDKAGLADQARTAKQEADQLWAQLKPCPTPCTPFHRVK